MLATVISQAYFCLVKKKISTYKVVTKENEGNGKQLRRGKETNAEGKEITREKC